MIIAFFTVLIRRDLQRTLPLNGALPFVVVKDFIHEGESLQSLKRACSPPGLKMPEELMAGERMFPLFCLLHQR